MSFPAEYERILGVYRGHGLADNAGATYFGYRDPAHVIRVHERYVATLRLLLEGGFCPLKDLRILDIGCGDGAFLLSLLQWGATISNLAGVELREECLGRIRLINPALDVRCASGDRVPWHEGTFDLVCQHTVFTSILDDRLRRAVACEMRRVLRPGGCVLWYDFAFNNPTNPNVRGIPRREVVGLFPGFSARLKRLTLAPFVARTIPAALLPICYPILSGIPLMRTHYLGLLRKP